LVISQILTNPAAMRQRSRCFVFTEIHMLKSSICPIFVFPIIVLCAFIVANVVNVGSTNGEVPSKKETSLGDSDERLAFSPQVHAVLAAHCADCHGADTSEGEVRFDQLDSLARDQQLALLNKAQEQVFFGLMPPADAGELTAKERSEFTGAIRSELQKYNASELDQKLHYPEYGNYVDHEKLFSGEIEDSPFTPARRWLVSPQIFEWRVLDVFKLNAGERDKVRGRLFGVTNPFILPMRSGVRYYDINSLDGGHLLVMLGNAEWISKKQIHSARIKHGEIKVDQFDNPKDRWYPPQTLAAFEKIILSEESPSQDDLVAAIQTQFDCVFQRKATESELNKYLQLTRAAIDLGGNTEGLRQMLIAVLLESEFLYRLELGAGEIDEHGRQKLSSREASYAIAYALGDQGPDAGLVAAVQEDRLLTKEDYRREVTRLLADEKYFRGQVDPTISGQHYRSNETAHPRIVRFFRDFFGYPAAINVFKDLQRSGGYYENPGRGTAATPGRLILETDRIVTRFVEQDQNVFENLLTSDEFFVYHNKENENVVGQKIIDEWNQVWEHLKETEWRTKPEAVLKENLEFIKQRKSLNIQDESRAGELVNYMHFFEESFGQGHTPFTTVPWAHGYYWHHSPSYNLLPTPPVGRYGSWKSLEYLGNKTTLTQFWDYPVVQPFKIENRKGILTHPSWLIAHSLNTETDPVRRGRWVREKLLADFTPDVPITVDAQVPEDPHRTLRERLVEVTSPQECWKCHQHMNPLGLPFEAFDDFGRFRTEEKLEHPENIIGKSPQHNGGDIYKTKPVVANGALEGTGDPQLDGEVRDVFELIDRIAKSDRARQSIIRYAFRFYLGRNELLSDSQTLIDADRAYLESGGSFKAVIVSLLTSDSFIYRK